MELSSNPGDVLEAVEPPVLGEAIKESHAAIAEAAPVKRKPGRHKNDCECEICVSKRASGVKPPEKKEKPPTASVPAIPAEILKPVVNFPFGLMAQKTKWPDWNLSNQEQEQNAVLLEKVMARYFPQLESNHAELVGLAMGLGIAAFSRYVGFQQYIQESRKNAGNSASPNDTRQTDNVDSPVQNKRRVDNSPSVKPQGALLSILDGANQAPQL